MISGGFRRQRIQRRVFALDDVAVGLQPGADGLELTGLRANDDGLRLDGLGLNGCEEGAIQLVLRVVRGEDGLRPQRREDEEENCAGKTSDKNHGSAHLYSNSRAAFCWACCKSVTN